MLTLFRCLIALLCLAAANSAFAGTINLFGGSAVFGPGLLATGVVSLIGDRGFTLNGFGDNIGGDVGPANQCLGAPGMCSPGTTISLHAAQCCNDFPGQATLDGVFYPHVGSLTPPNTANALIEFTGSVVAPPFGQSSTAILTTPVAFSGAFSVDEVDHQERNQLVALAFATLTLLLLGSAMAGLGLAWRRRSR